MLKGSWENCNILERLMSKLQNKINFINHVIYMSEKNIHVDYWLHTSYDLAEQKFGMSNLQEIKRSSKFITFEVLYENCKSE